MSDSQESRSARPRKKRIPVRSITGDALNEANEYEESLRCMPAVQSWWLNKLNPWTPACANLRAGKMQRPNALYPVRRLWYSFSVVYLPSCRCRALSKACNYAERPKDPYQEYVLRSLTCPSIADLTRLVEERLTRYTSK